MFIEELEENELKEIVETLSDKYDLQAGYFEMYEAEKLDDGLLIKIGWNIIEYGFVITTYKTVFVDDFDFSADVYGEDVDNITHDYRRIMYAKFGEKYKKELIKSLLEDKLQRIKDLDEELEEINLAAIEELTKQK